MGNPDVRVPERASEVDVGSGGRPGCGWRSLAGFTTALHAHELGAKVVVLEKASQIGRVRSQGGRWDVGFRTIGSCRGRCSRSQG